MNEIATTSWLSVVAKQKCVLHRLDAVVELPLYREICASIVAGNQQRFDQQFEQLQTRELLWMVNRLAVDGQSVLGLNLCHLAAMHGNGGAMRQLLRHGGGDLSQRSAVILNGGTVELGESVLVLLHHNFAEPLDFLSREFDAAVRCVNRTGDDYEFCLDFSVLCPPSGRRPHTVDTAKQMTVLCALLDSSQNIRSDENKLLMHPLIECFLSWKWQHYRLFFLFLVFLQLFFALTLSATFFNALAACKMHEHMNGTNQTNTTTTVATDEFGQLLARTQLFSSLALIAATFLLIHGVIQIKFISFRQLMGQFEMLFNICTVFVAFVLCIWILVRSTTGPGDGNANDERQWLQSSAGIVILPVWINLMLLVGRVPALGCYSLMFATVLVNFLKVMTSFIFLIIGFALSFALVCDAESTRPLYHNPADAALKTLVMMIGEFDYGDTFGNSDTALFGASIQFIFLLFIISCSVILMNLTQGIAVNDIKLLMEISQVIRLQKETRFLYELESFFLSALVVANPFCREIKRYLYDHGIMVGTKQLTVRRTAKQGLANRVYDILVKDYKLNQ